MEILSKNKYIIPILVIFILASWFYYRNYYESFGNYEHFNDQTGKLCNSCVGKSFNQCLGCFNCGFCVDKYGNSGCIAGDQNGPYNYESCARWYYSDPYSFMIQKNALKNFDKQYYKGTLQENRVIGTDPC
jgi:hypothetical protein